MGGGSPVLQVHPSRLCNLACSHCYTASGPKLRGALPPEMLASALEDAAALGYRRLAVSGGEPLLYDGLTTLLAQARSLGMVTTITTNGMLATEERWRPLAPLVDLVAVSIDGTEADHDRLRGQPGAFARTIERLETIRASGVPFGFLFTLTQYNADSLEDLVRLAAAHGARSLQVHPLTLHGRARETLPDARPDALELIAALSEAARLARETDVALHVDALDHRQIAAHRAQLVPARPIGALTDVAPVLIVEANGGVMPLTHELSPAFRLGSLEDAPLAQLAEPWLASGGGAALAAVCEQTWAELSADPDAHASYWYDEVAARSHGAPLRLRGRAA